MEENIQILIWKKVITNCVFNSICPLLEIDNGVFHRNAAALEIGKKVIGECIEVADANGIALTTDDVLQNVLTISKMSDGQKISTYQDILKLCHSKTWPSFWSCFTCYFTAGRNDEA
jgi:2-dehydropantoate 2-reductase